jgi:hypothetical protein
MRILKVLTLLVLVISGSATASRAANDAPWCYRDFGGPQYTNCSYYSAQQCLAAAGVLGGVCERNHRPASEETKKIKRKSPRQVRAPQT